MSEKPPIVNVTQIHRGCGSGCGSGCALIILAIIGGSFLSSYLYEQRTKNPQPQSAESTPAPTPARTPAPAKATTPIPLPQESQAVDEAKRLAIKYHPDLGIPGSRLNTEFLARHKRYQTEKPAFFNNPSWPLVLVEESVQALKAKQ